MKATVDANILFSALLREGSARRVWFGPEIELFAPAFLIKEFQKHASFLQKKFSGSEKEFQLLSQKLVSQVFLVTDNELKPYLPAASTLSKDSKDWLYIACALKENTIIWSNDRHFKEQNRIKVCTTAEMLKEFGAL